MKILVNGQLLEDHEATVSAYDHGFLYGLGLFETLRTYGGRPFLLDQHLARLNEGCHILGIPHVAEQSRVREEIARLLSVNGMQDAYIRYSVSAGVHELGLVRAFTSEPTVVIYMKPLSMVEEWYTSGRPVQLLRTVRPIPETRWRLKSFQYMNGWLAKRELMNYPWAQEAEGIQLNERSELTEGIVSNLFFVKDQVLHTPSLATGVLPGVTRDYVMRLASDIGCDVVEGEYCSEELLEADEIFLTNSIQEIVPVREVYLPDGSSTVLSNRVPGAITSQLMRLYGEQA